MSKHHWLTAILLATVGTAQAHDPLTDAINAAYPPYRAALFRTNTQAQAEAKQALQQARASWQAVIEGHGKHPPAPYDRDPQVLATLTEVTRVYERADAQVQAGQLAEAHETLEGARGLMAELRRRNGVVTYSDHMNAFHAEMEHTLAEGKTLDTSPQRLLPLMGRVGVLDYLARRLRSEAPPTLAADPAFAAALQAVEQSVQALRDALLTQEPARIRPALEQLKKPYAQMFLRFG